MNIFARSYSNIQYPVGSHIPLSVPFWYVYIGADSIRTASSMGQHISTAIGSSVNKRARHFVANVSTAGWESRRCNDCSQRTSESPQIPSKRTGRRNCRDSEGVCLCAWWNTSFANQFMTELKASRAMSVQVSKVREYSLLTPCDLAQSSSH